MSAVYNFYQFAWIGQEVKRLYWCVRGGEFSFSNLRNQPVRRLIGHLAVVPFLPSVVSAVGWQPKGWQQQQEQEQALS